MEIRDWISQQLVLPSDMNGSTCDMYQRNFDYNNFPPMILYGLQLSSISGNTVAFSIGAARTQEITVSNYPYLPVPTYGTGYPGIIEISSGNNSITLNVSMSPCYIVATYSISPSIAAQTLYTVTGSLAQVTSVNSATQVILGYATYSLGVWTVDQTPGTHRNFDASGASAIEYDLTTNKLIIGSPQGQSSTGIILSENTIAQDNMQVLGSIYDANNYMLNTSKTDIPTTLTPINALTSATTLIRFTGSDATIVNGIVAGIAQHGAQQLLIYNESSANIQFNNLSGSALAANQILVAGGGSITLNAGYVLGFVYDNTAQLWIPSIPSAGGGGGGIDTISTSTPAITLTNPSGPTCDIEIADATESVAGLMSAADKTKLDGLSPGSVTYNVDVFTLTSLEILAGQVTLTGTPTMPSLSVLNVIGGPVQEYSVDYTISGTTLSWLGLGLASILTSGDVIIIQFF